jgi:hypothetical protein
LLVRDGHGGGGARERLAESRILSIVYWSGQLCE